MMEREIYKAYLINSVIKIMKIHNNILMILIRVFFYKIIIKQPRFLQESFKKAKFIYYKLL